MNNDELLEEYITIKYTTAADIADYGRLFESVHERSKRELPRGYLPIICNAKYSDVVRNLPKKLKVFRGYNQDDKRDGLSWTLSKDIAEWFALRGEWNNEPAGSCRIVEGECSIKNVYAYTNDCNEEEIIISPDRVKKKRECVIEYNPDRMQELKTKREALSKLRREQLAAA